MTFEQFLETFEKMVPNFVAAVRAIDHDYVGDANPPDDAAAHALRDACGTAVGGMFGIKIAPDSSRPARLPVSPTLRRP